MTKQQKTNRNSDKNRNIRSQKSKFFVEFSDAIMNVDSFACFDVIFLEKKCAMRLPSQKKQGIYYVTLI